MERLTYDFCVGNKHCWQVKGADNLECREVCRNQCEKGCTDCPIAKAFDRLAAYEETGLDPEEIERILDSYGRGMTLRTENAQRLGIIKEISTNRLRELAQAEKEGRLVVLQNVKYTDSDGEKALRHAMYMCGVQNNPVTRYTADAIAEKLTREAAEAALEEREAEHDR